MATFIRNLREPTLINSWDSEGIMKALDSHWLDPLADAHNVRVSSSSVKSAPQLKPILQGGFEKKTYLSK